MRRKGFYACRCGACGKCAIMGNDTVEVETGFALCRDRGGVLTFGPAATGDRYSVEIPVECPPGSEFFGLYHTHPGGTTAPSRADIESARMFGASALCVEVPETGDLQCYEMPLRGRR